MTGGFTVIEIMVVVAIIVIIGSVTMATNMDSFRGYSFRDERDILINTLTRARSMAVNNMCFGETCEGGKPHGIHFEADKYTIFQGSTWASRDGEVDEVIEINPVIEISTSLLLPFDVIFAQLSGDVLIGVLDITISDDTFHTSIISLNSEGQIKWTN